MFPDEDDDYLNNWQTQNSGNWADSHYQSVSEYWNKVYSGRNTGFTR